MSKIDVLIQVRDKFTNHFSRLQKNLKKGGAAFRVFARRVSGAIAVVAAGVAKGVSGLSKYEKGIARIEALSGGFRNDRLRKEIQDIIRMTGRDGVEAVNAFYEATSRGVPQNRLADFMRVAAKAAVVDGSSMVTAVEGITTVMNAFGMRMGETERIAEMLFSTVADGATTMERLSAEIATVAPSAAGAGVKLEEVLAATQVLTKSGVTTSTAMTQISAVIDSLTKTFGAAWREEMTLEEGMNNLRTEASAQGKTLLELVGRKEAFRAITVLTEIAVGEMSEAMIKMSEDSNKLDQALEGTTSEAIKFERIGQDAKLVWMNLFSGLDKRTKDWQTKLHHALDAAAMETERFANKQDNLLSEIGGAVGGPFGLLKLPHVLRGGVEQFPEHIDYRQAEKDAQQYYGALHRHTVALKEQEEQNAQEKAQREARLRQQQAELAAKAAADEKWHAKQLHDFKVSLLKQKQKAEQKLLDDQLQADLDAAVEQDKLERDKRVQAQRDKLENIKEELDALKARPELFVPAFEQFVKDRKDIKEDKEDVAKIEERRRKIEEKMKRQGVHVSRKDREWLKNLKAFEKHQQDIKDKEAEMLEVQKKIKTLLAQNLQAANFANF